MVECWVLIEINTTRSTGRLTIDQHPGQTQVMINIKFLYTHHRVFKGAKHLAVYWSHSIGCQLRCWSSVVSVWGKYLLRFWSSVDGDLDQLLIDGRQRVLIAIWPQMPLVNDSPSLLGRAVILFNVFVIYLEQVIPAMSLFLYLNFLALHNRTPSMIDAWFSSSLKMASSGLRRASNKPVFASKQEAYKIASSRSWNPDIFSSSSLWISYE